MSNLRNSVQLIGRLGTDPIVKTFGDGKKMASFRMATSENYTNSQGEKVEDTQWHNIVVWGKKVDVVENFLKKGKEVAIEGKLVNRSYEKDGETRYISEINLNELQMFGGKD